MMRILFSLFIAVLLLSSCKTSYLWADREKMDVPPGTAPLKQDVFLDQSEVPNIAWREYYFWVRKTFGQDSEQAEALIPLQNAWRSTKFSNLSTGYTFAFEGGKIAPNEYAVVSKYGDLPVVGISKAQAEAYCAWRSDRVFEMMLIRGKAIEPNSNQMAKDYFTINRYLDSEYLNYEYDSRFEYYPRYRLPTLAELDAAARHPKAMLTTDTKAHALRQTANEQLIGAPYLALSAENQPGFYFLDSNASEITDNGVFGGNWQDGISLSPDATNANPLPSVTLGFRCACEWVRVNENRYWVD